jgi:hypothetical protein
MIGKYDAFKTINCTVLDIWCTKMNKLMEKQIK